jgi:small subunit ribosomal protein S20
MVEKIKSKKERNRKIVKQNKRNKIVNKRYVTTIKTLSKLFSQKISEFEKTTEKAKIKTETFSVLKNLYSIIDKAVKKGVIHKNTAARKKSKVGKLYVKIQY